MKKRISCALLTAALVMSAGCSRYAAAKEFSLFAMDTLVNVTLYAGKQETVDKEQAIMSGAVSSIEKALSVTREDSDISRVNRKAGQQGATVGGETIEVLTHALELCELTGGALDITAYPAVKAWGFTTEEHRVPDPAELAELSKKIDYTAVKLEGETVTLPAGMELDLGAVAKGYAGDLLAAYVRANEDVLSALLDLGQSTIVAVGSKPGGKPWRIGVVDPARPENYFSVVELEDMAMGTSGGYQRYFEQDGITYWHILDPDTAAPARSGLASVTVVSPSARICDGLSTALFVMGLEKGTAFWRDHPELEFEAIFVTEDGEIYRTAGLEGRFSLAEGYADREVTVLE